MKKEIVDAIKAEIEREFWGYNVYYYQQYEDLIIDNLKIKKENMKWKKESCWLSRQLLGRTLEKHQETVYIFVDKKNKIVLFR